MSMHPPPIFITTAPMYPDNRVFVASRRTTTYIGGVDGAITLTPETHLRGTDNGHSGSD